jgi:two-component sensor histidine kinase/integral membrane sensor domain MASE1
MKNGIKPIRYLGLILLVAAAYAGSGRLGLLLAIPPGYATAVWPPSGIALAGMLVLGYRLWPGVWLGSFVVNLWPASDATQAVSVHSAAVAAGLGVGATLQAASGAFLIHRFVGFPNPLNTEADVIRFFVLGGPVSCLVAATVGNMTLLLEDVISWAQVPFSWWTWWVGDTIGVLVMAPLVLIWIAEPRQIWRRRQSSVGLVLGLAFAAVVVFFLYARAWERERSALEFEQLADRMAHALRITLSDHLEVLYAIEGFYASSPEIERQEFHAFVKRALARHHSIQALSWNPQVTDAERAAFEEAAQREGYSDFRITEQYAPGQMMRAAQRPEYVPIYYIEPYRGNEPALGFDVASDPVRREALGRACDTGAPMTSGRITPVQAGGNRSGIVIYLPIYRSGSPPDTLAERRRDLQGYAAGVFQIGDLIEAALQGLERAGIEIRLYDDAAVAEERLLYVYGAKERNVSPAVNAAQGEASAGQALQSSSSLDVAGRRWTFTFAPTHEYLASHPPWQAWTVLASGLLFTSLLGAFLLVVTGRSSLIEQLVVQRTAELSAALQEKATLLQEVHHRVKNNLQIISSLLNLQVAYAPDPRLGVLFAESQSRVRAMALIHQLLYERKDFSRVHLGEYLERLGQLLASSYGVKEKRVAVWVEADEVYIKLDRAVPCGLLVNELVTNAFKHAFPPPPSPSPLVRTPTPSLPRGQGGGEGVGDRLAYGEIRIELRAAKGEAVLTVSDNGVGLPAGLDPAKAQSLGLQLVAVLTDQIGGTLTVRSGPGTRFDLHFPLGVGENKIS